ncbi:MAG: flagellar motor protein MotB [Selenomonadaceae bacterium]|nr:flagellar motor protein MotB [Selenomonadaceae bacterium]
MARKKRPAPHEEEASEAWLLPYSDLMTLLLALFICLFAISQTDETKMTQMAQAFSAAFNLGGPSFFNQAGPVANNSRDLMNDEDAGAEAYMQENQQLTNIKKQMDEFIDQNNLESELSTELSEDGLMIRIKENALFPSGSADLLPESQKIAPVIGALLAPLSQRVQVSGHTDNVPISTPQFPSNWELSTMRALNFMKLIMAQDARLAPARFSALGSSEYRPVAPNDTDAGRAANRRVEVMIIRSNHIENTGMQTVGK